MPFLHGKPVRVDRETWYGLTSDDSEKTFTNIGTLTLNHVFNDQLNLRNVLRYSHVDRRSVPSIPAVICSNALVTRRRRSSPA